ncbi:MAG: phytanoyl-CoA dioxygenase family protein [Caldilineaceae bacterium]|nr:phytanoyl-CoA dioxygenase family protein [Caldilineaceae bacterium]
MTIQPFTDSHDLLPSAADLHTQMKQDSYLFISGLIPHAQIDQVYSAIMQVCRQEGWVDARDRAQGNTVVEGDEAFWAVYDPLQKLACFHALAHQPQILKVIEALVQETPFVHPRNIARITYPQTAHFTTPPHQDFVHIQGTAETYTVWFPLSDCPRELGNLEVLAGSHTQSILPVHRAAGAGGLGVDADNLGLTWRGGDFAAGDVLIFHSHTVHRAIPNRTKDQLRISVDYRYQGVSQPIVADGLLPHYNRLTWDEIYADWTRPELQYYWRDLKLKVVERDRSYHQNAR